MQCLQVSYNNKNTISLCPYIDLKQQKEKKKRSCSSEVQIYSTNLFYLERVKRKKRKRNATK